MVRTEATADDSLTAILARSRFGMAIAAMIRIMATTINSSISEKPFCLELLARRFRVRSMVIFRVVFRVMENCLRSRILAGSRRRGRTKPGGLSFLGYKPGLKTWVTAQRFQHIGHSLFFTTSCLTHS